MALEFIGAEIRLVCLKFRRADEDGFAGLRDALSKKSLPGFLVEVFDNVAQKDEIVRRQFANEVRGIANMDRVIKITMHGCQVSGMAFDAVDFHTPIAPAISGRIVFGGEDIGIFAEKMAPFAEADADVENRGGSELLDDMYYRRNRVGAAARHVTVEAERP